MLGLSWTFAHHNTTFGVDISSAYLPDAALLTVAAEVLPGHWEAALLVGAGQQFQKTPETLSSDCLLCYPSDACQRCRPAHTKHCKVGEIESCRLAQGSTQSWRPFATFSAGIVKCWLGEHEGLPWEDAVAAEGHKTAVGLVRRELSFEVPGNCCPLACKFQGKQGLNSSRNTIELALCCALHTSKDCLVVKEVECKGIYLLQTTLLRNGSNQSSNRSSRQ